MSLTTEQLPTRSYPYVREFWQDQAGSLRWTLTTSKAAVVSALLAMLVAFALGRLLTIVYTLSHAFYFHGTATTLLDDQANAIAANSYNPSALLMNLFQLAYYTGRRAFASKIGRTMLMVGFLLLL